MILYKAHKWDRNNWKGDVEVVYSFYTKIQYNRKACIIGKWIVPTCDWIGIALLEALLLIIIMTLTLAFLKQLMKLLSFSHNCMPFTELFISVRDLGMINDGWNLIESLLLT